MRQLSSILALVLVFLATGWFSISFAQSGASAPGNPPAPKPATAQQSATPADKKEQSTKLQKMVNEHKVITNEDMEKLHVAAGDKSAAQPERAASSSDAFHCDEECAKQARDIAGMGDDEEGEWQTQLAAARHFIVTDAEWKDAIWNGFDRTRTYCTFQKQLQTATPPSGDDYHSRYERAKQENYAEEMGRTLTNGVQSASERLNRLIDKTEETDPVRAAVMSVLAGRALNQCGTAIEP